MSLERASRSESAAKAPGRIFRAAPTLDALAREGARQMPVTALAVEVAQYVDEHQGERDTQGHRLVVRNGRARPRKVTCGAGTLEVPAPRVNDRCVDATGQRQRFTSRILPPCMRRSPKLAEVLPILYLRGLSTGDFREALPVLLGDDAAGLSATNIARLTAVWEDDYRRFRSGTWLTATTCMCGSTASTSTSGSKTTVCARW